MCRASRSFRFYDDIELPVAERTVVEYTCPCEDQFRLSRYLLHCGIGLRYARMWWGDTQAAAPASQAFIINYAVECERYANNGIGLFLHGNNGNGKTMFATLMLKKFLSLGYDGYWTTFDQLLDRYTSTWRNPEERIWFDRTVRNAPVLVVDDVGRESSGRKSTVSVAAIDSMFRTRAQNALTTIVTTNESREQFMLGYSKAVASLVSETCLAHEFVGADWREQAHQQVTREMALGISRPVTLG